MALRNRRLNVRLVVPEAWIELAADIPDDVDLQDAEIEMTTELERIMAGRRQRAEASHRLRSGAPSFMGEGVSSRQLRSGKTAALEEALRVHEERMAREAFVNAGWAKPPDPLDPELQAMKNQTTHERIAALNQMLSAGKVKV